jgi:hypothetical protein
MTRLGRYKLLELLSQMEIVALRINVASETAMISSSVFPKRLINCTIELGRNFNFKL